MRKTVLPLYYRHADFDAGTPSAITLLVFPEENAEMITADNFGELAELLYDHPRPRLHLFDLPSEARAALAFELSGGREGSRVHHGDESDIVMLYTGEGLLLTFETQKEITDADFMISDLREMPESAKAAYGSWELTSLEIEEIMGAGVNVTSRANTIGGKISSQPEDVLESIREMIVVSPEAEIPSP